MRAHAREREMPNDAGIHLRVRRACKRWESARAEGTEALRACSEDATFLESEGGLLGDTLVEAHRERLESRSYRLRRSVEAMFQEAEEMRKASETSAVSSSRADAMLRLCERYRKETELKERVEHLSETRETRRLTKRKERAVLEQALWILHVYVDVEAQEKLFKRLSVGT